MCLTDTSKGGIRWKKALFQVTSSHYLMQLGTFRYSFVRKNCAELMCFTNKIALGCIFTKIKIAKGV